MGRNDKNGAGPKIWHRHRDSILLALSIFLWSMGLGMYNFIWPVYVKELGGSAVDLGLLLSLSGLVVTISAIPGGLWADRYDRKWVLVVGWAIGVPAPLLFILARNWVALVAGVFFYAFSAVSNPALQAYIVHSAPAENLAATFNLIFAAFPLGLVITPPIGSALATRYGMHAAFWAALVLYILSTLVLFGLTPQRAAAASAGAKTAPQALSDRRLIFLSFIFAAAMGVQSIGLPFATPFLQDVAHTDLATIGRLGSVASLSGFLLSPLIGRFADRQGATLAMALSMAVFAFSLGAMAAYPTSLAIIYLSFALRGSADGARGLMTSLVGRAIGKERLGQGYGIYNLIIGFVGLATPYLGGWLYQVGPAWPFWATAILTIVFLWPVIGVGQALAPPPASDPDLLPAAGPEIPGHGGGAEDPVQEHADPGAR